MLTLGEEAIVAVLGAWFAATLVYQCFAPRLAALRSRFDVFRLIPYYRLFSGRPRDLRVSYRDRLADGDWSAWHWVEPPRLPRWRHAFWNPGRLVADNIDCLADDLVSQMERRRRRGRADLVGPFVSSGIFRLVQRFTPAPGATERQFKVEEWGGHVSAEPPKMLFTSEPYPLVMGS